MSENEADLFRFEVPTSRGKFVVIGPDTLPPDEAARIGAQIGRLIPLLVNGTEREALLVERAELIASGVPDDDLDYPR